MNVVRANREPRPNSTSNVLATRPSRLPQEKKETFANCRSLTNESPHLGKRLRRRSPFFSVTCLGFPVGCDFRNARGAGGVGTKLARGGRSRSRVGAITHGECSTRVFCNFLASWSEWSCPRNTGRHNAHTGVCPTA